MTEENPKLQGPVPTTQQVYQYLLYGLSLPERAIRSGISVVGGAAKESVELLVPQAFQDSRTYRVLVRQTLDFLLKDVGGVAGDPNAPAEPTVENFVARKAVGNFVEMAGLATLHVSPVLALAILSDIAYGSQTYLKELSAELKQAGVISQSSTIDHVDDLLAAVVQASGVTAEAFNTPPLSVDGLKQTIEQTREALEKIDPATVLPAGEIQRLWEEIEQVAAKEHTGLLGVSGALSMHALGKVTNLGKGALSTIRVAGSLFDRVILDHYMQAIGDLSRDGLYQTLSKTSEPYVEAVWNNFAATRETLTEDVVTGRFFARACKKVRGWFGGQK